MTPREIALRILVEAEEKQRLIDKTFTQWASRYTLSGRDRRFVQEITYGVTRLRRRLDYVIDQYCQRKLPHSRLRNVLRMGAYQILSMNVPDHAAVHETVGLLRGGSQRVVAFANAVLRRISEEGETVSFPDARDAPVEFLGTYHSHPEWLVRRWLGRFGYEATRRLCEFDNETPPICLRVNRQRGSVEEVVAMLRRERVDCSPGRYLKYVLRVDGGVRLSDLGTFTRGFVQVQDESAALVGELASPRRGEVAVDLCASPGGKSTHIAELMRDDGVVVAVDVSESRLRPLTENLQRLGLNSVLPVVSDSRYFTTREVGLVILDVPCSGTGTLRRRPDLRWRRAESDLYSLKALQRELLENAANILRPGGRLVYSTCSIEPEENEEVVTGFLADMPQFTIEAVPEWVPRDIVRDESYVSTLPHVHGIDGMFACVLVKKPS